MKFKISSALKDHIGKELITNDNVAIFELVKNSYDAGAKSVKVVFKDMRSQYPKILVIDNGSGMSKNDIENKWLFVAYSEKRNHKPSSKNKRFMAGSKGLGRFSCDRLGSKLNIYTKVPTDKNFNLLKIDWDKFEKDQEKEFREIEVELKPSESKIEDYKIIKYSGTIIEISDLRSEWDWKKLQSLKRYLQRLINPLQIPNEDSFEIELIAEDFKIDDNKQKYDYDRVNGKVENIVYEQLKVKTTTIDCSISQDGKQIITSLNDKGIKIFELKEDNKFKLSNIKIKVSFLNREAKSTFKRLMGVDALNYGNLFVFKNGFRVLPYGETEDDWLKLNLRKAQGYARNLGTREVLGRIEINDPENQYFKEVTSRSEGLIGNIYFEQLKELVLEFAIKRLEKYVVGAIDWDSEREDHPTKKKKEFEAIKKDSRKIIEQIAGGLTNKDLWYNEDFLEIVERKTIEKIPETIKNIESITKKEKDSAVRDLYFQQIKSLKQGLALQKSKQQEELEKKEQNIVEKEKETLFLSRALTNDQERLMSLIHIIENSIGPIEDSLSEINKKIKDNAPIKEIVSYIDKIFEETNKIRLVNDIAGVTGFNTKVQAINKDLVQYIVQYLDNLRSSEIKFSFQGDNNYFEYRFVPLRILIILDNLISNSRKAGANKMLFKFKTEKKQLIIEVSDDSGKKISVDNSKNLFNRGFTTTKGAGIGLYSIKNNLREMNGDIEFIGNNLEGHLNGACFRMKVKK